LAFIGFTPFELPMKAIYWLLCDPVLFTAAISGSPIQSKQKFAEPSFAAVEAMYVMPSTPFISSSSDYTV
jgi:hypothetical protein